MSAIVCIQLSDLVEFGCPHCGGRQTHTVFEFGATQKMGCVSCSEDFVALADGVSQSSTSIRVGASQVFPRVRRHPLRGTRKLLRSR